MRSVPKTSEVTFNVRDTVLQVNYCETCCRDAKDLRSLAGSIRSIVMVSSSVAVLASHYA